MSSIFIIICRILASPAVNLFQKKLTNRNVRPEFIVMVSYLFFVLLSIPVFIILQPFNFPTEFWVYVLLLGVLDILGNMFLVKSLSTIDLSVFGPLNAFKPVFALIVSAFLLSEIPSVTGLGGVCVIVAGSLLLADRRELKGRPWYSVRMSRGIWFRLFAILLTSIAAVISKKVILMSSPLITLAYWSVVGLPVAVIFFRLSGRGYTVQWSEFKSSGRHFVGLLLSFLILQLFTLLTFQKVFVGYSLAFFQLSGLVSVLIGFHFFNEKNIKRRLTGAIIMCAGAMLIAIYG